MLAKLYRPPVVGLVAFVTVLLGQPIGHSILVLLRSYVSSLGEEALASFGLGLVGFVLVWVGMKKTETPATWLGFVGGILIWTGWFEITWKLFAYLCQIQPLVDDSGQVLLSPGLQMIEASGLILFAMLVFFFFDRETRCTAFKWLHRTLRLDPGKASAARARDYARITALETVTVIWTLYVVNIALYDQRILGERHPVTYAVFFGCLIWAVYLNTRLIKYARMAPAVRYAIPTTVITWLDIEVMSRWGLLDEFWIKPWDYALEMTLVLAAFVVAGVAIYLTPERGDGRGEDKDSPAA